MKRTILIAALLWTLALLATAAGADRAIAIINGRIVVGDGTVIDGGTVLIENGKITQVTEGTILPEDGITIDAKGLWVCPGMIDPYTTIGMVEVSMDSATNDTNESTQIITPHLRATDGFNPDSAIIPVTRVGGITTVLSSPGSGNPINGQAAVFDLAGRTCGEMLIAQEAAMIFSFSNRATRQGSFPTTRPGLVAAVRQALYDARQYEAGKLKQSEEGKGGRLDLKNEALLPVINGDMPVIAEARSVQEIRAAISVADEFGLDLILLNPSHAYKLLDEIKQREIPVLLGNTFNLPAEDEPFDRYFSLAAELHRAGILFAFTTATAHNVRTLPTLAAKSVAYGLPEEEAIKAVTLNAARILRIDDMVGSLEPGKTANIVLWDGHPLQGRSRVVRLFIRGEEIELRSRQEDLRDKFMDIGEAK